MGGGLMQLVAYGAQDVYLTGNPQITFFKVVYRRHTNFAMESIQQTFNGSEGLGNKVTATISRNGDLVHNMYVQMSVTETFGRNASHMLAVENLGHRLLSEVEIEIGGQKIDKHYSRWLDIWAELTVPSSKRDGYWQMVNLPDPVTGADTSRTGDLYVPLQFWFCRNPGLALPLIALQYHEVKVNITFASTNDIKDGAFATLVADATGAIDTLVSSLKANLWVDYIYLDTDERKRFAQVSHEYLIEQLQYTGAESSSTNGSHRLNFNHPIKELVWTHNDTASLAGWNKNVAITSAKLTLNGHDRFTQRNAPYFSLVQPYQHHTRVPCTSETVCLNINVYSFAIKPEDHQPSGTCNMSRIDNATLNISAVGVNHNMHIYAVNYNVLRIMGGMGGLAYSN